MVFQRTWPNARLAFDLNMTLINRRGKSSRSVWTVGWATRGSPSARPSPLGLTITHNFATDFTQSRRDCALQPRVASNEQPWDHESNAAQPQRGCVGQPRLKPQPRRGCRLSDHVSQGSSCLATLGFGPESLWDSRSVPSKMWVMLSGLRHKYDDVRVKGFFAQTRRERRAYPAVDL